MIRRGAIGRGPPQSSALKPSRGALVGRWPEGSGGRVGRDSATPNCRSYLPLLPFVTWLLRAETKELASGCETRSEAVVRRVGGDGRGRGALGRVALVAEHEPEDEAGGEAAQVGGVVDQPHRDAHHDVDAGPEEELGEERRGERGEAAAPA